MVSGSVASRDIPVDGEKRETRISPLSTTAVTPSIVTDVSAMDVASITLRRGEG
jgi:hypothetical protein